MSHPNLSSQRSAGADPIHALLDAPGGGVLAIIAGIEGPSCRPMGAMMAVLADGTRRGTLLSGCIEADIALHAAQALSAGTPRLIRYGKGSPYVDIELPCGGGWISCCFQFLTRQSLTTSLGDRRSGSDAAFS